MPLFERLFLLYNQEMRAFKILPHTADLRLKVSGDSPEAYKSVDEVVGVVHNAGLAKKVARMRPIAVIKG